MSYRGAQSGSNQMNRDHAGAIAGPQVIGLPPQSGETIGYAVGRLVASVGIADRHLEELAVFAHDLAGINLPGSNTASGQQAPGPISIIDHLHLLLDSLGHRQDATDYLLSTLRERLGVIHTPGSAKASG